MKNEVLYVLDRRISKGKRFVNEDLETILDIMPQMIPNNHDIGFNYDLPLAMVYYVPYMIAGYHQMIKKGEQPK